MALLQKDHALDVLRDIVERSTADETEATLECVEDNFVRYADEGPTQSADRECYEVAIRARFAAPDGGFREARATCGSLAPEDTTAALERAIVLAKISDPNPELVPLGGPVEVAETAPERPTMDHTFREKAEWIEKALAACGSAELAPSGLAQTTAMSRALVNSAGREVHGARTRAAFSLTASAREGNGGSGFAEGIHPNVERLDPEGTIERAVRRAVENREPRPLEPGDYTVVLEPSAVSSILLFAAYEGFGAQEVAEKASFLCGRVGEVLFPTDLAIVDDAANDHYPGYLFDGEGAPRRRIDLLTGGKLGAPVTDSRWAKKLGVENTGHGEPQPSSSGPSAQNLVVHPGTSSIEELIAGVDDGLLVSQFHYTNMIEPLDMTLTGMTRNGTFRIEKGRVTHPVKNLRFTETLVNALGRVTGIGRDLEVAGALFDGEIVCPPLRIDRFRFTSTTDF